MIAPGKGPILRGYMPMLKGLLHQVLDHLASLLAVSVVLMFAASFCAVVTLALLLKWERSRGGSSRREDEDV
jgi:hypothetical protein